MVIAHLSFRDGIRNDMPDLQECHHHGCPKALVDPVLLGHIPGNKAVPWLPWQMRCVWNGSNDTIWREASNSTQVHLQP